MIAVSPPSVRETLRASLPDYWFVLEDDPRPGVCADEFVRSDGIAGLLEKWTANFPPATDCRAVASLWGTSYINRFIGPTIAANAHAAWDLPAALDEIDYILSDNGDNIVALRPHCLGEETRGTAFERLYPLFSQHVEPVVEQVSAWASMSPRVLWGTVARALERVARDAETSPVLAGGYRDLLTIKSWSDKRTNPLFRALKYTPSVDGLRCERKVCCLTYRIPGRICCGDCPTAIREAVEDAPQPRTRRNLPEPTQ